MSAALSPTSSTFSLLCEVIRAVARSGGLPSEDVDDFSQSVHLRLLERNYAPLAQFSGRSSLRTYLTVVVRRMLLDWRNARQGKWRPSSRARRLGPPGVELDRLISRDGHPVDEAIAILASRSSHPGPAVLRECASRVPARCRFRTVVPDDLAGLSIGAFEDPVEAEQVSAARLDTLRRLRRALRRLPVEERFLLHLRFGRNMSVSAIAAQRGEPAKPLYRRIARVVSSLRRSLASNVAEATDRRPDLESLHDSGLVH